MEHDRQRLIQVLVLESFDRVRSLGHSVWMQRVLEKGFVGFANMTDQQLVDECRRFGLTERHLDDRAPPPDDGGDDETAEPLATHLAIRGMPPPAVE